MLQEQGSCDISFGLPGLARFRVNVFLQRGSCAVVMRVMPSRIPDFAWLGLPAHLGDVAKLGEGMVLVTGARGAGKSSILAALLDCINEHRTCHILTIEDPIEFLYTHKRATIHQRELHSDAPSFPLALRAAMRQAPKVILISELRDHETMEMALEAAENGYLLLSSLSSPSAAKAVEIEQVEIQLKYAGYIARQNQQIQRLRGLESQEIPAHVDFLAITGLSNEAREKMQRVRPRSVGQAARIGGVTPADVGVLLMYLEALRRTVGRAS